MEKSGKPGLSARLRRLLILAAALCGASPLFAYEAELFVSSYEITAGTPVLFEFSIRDAEPGSTRLAEPEMPASFAPTASRKELRDLSDDGRWGVLTTGHRTATVISREWVPSEAGTFSLGPFVMFVGEETLSLPPVTLTVNSSPVLRAAAIRWAPPASIPYAGSPLLIVLEGRFEGTAGRVACAAPENALLESAGLPGGEGDNPEWKALAAWYWTPLETGSQKLPSATLEYTPDSGASLRLVSPPMSVLVAAGKRGSAAFRDSGALLRAFAPAPGADSSQPEKSAADLSVGLPEGLAVSSPDPVLSEAASLWSVGKYAEALASLRRAEYRRLFPSSCRAARLSAELALGLGKTRAVPPSAWKPVCVIGAVVCGFLALSLRVFRLRLPLFRHLSRAVFAAALALALAAVYIYSSDTSGAAVLREGILYHIPEYSSTPVERMPAGAPVRIIRESGPWLYVETAAGLRGWVPSDRAEIYTASNAGQSGEIQ